MAAFESPVEANFLSEFHENKENVEWLEKVTAKLGADRLSEVSALYPMLFERIIAAMVARNRSAEIFHLIELYLSYFDDFDLANILDAELKDEQKLLEAWPIYMYGRDKQGHPVFYDELPSSDIANLFKVFTAAAAKEDEAKNSESDKMNSNESKHDDADDEYGFSFDSVSRLWRRFRFKFYARLSREKQLESARRETTILRHVLVWDLRNFSYRRFAAHFSMLVRIGKTVITDEQLMFPETMHRVLLVNAPWSFALLWKVISTVIDTGTATKIKIVGADESLAAMLEVIDIAQIPNRYGGEGPWEVRLGLTAGTKNADVNVDDCKSI